MATNWIWASALGASGGGAGAPPAVAGGGGVDIVFKGVAKPTGGVVPEGGGIRAEDGAPPTSGGAVPRVWPWFRLSGGAWDSLGGHENLVPDAVLVDP